MARRVVSGPVVVGRMRAALGAPSRSCSPLDRPMLSGPRVMWPMHGVDSQGWETVVGDHQQTAVAAARGTDSPRTTVIQARRRTTRDACSRRGVYGRGARCAYRLRVARRRRRRCRARLFAAGGTAPRRAIARYLVHGAAPASAGCWLLAAGYLEQTRLGSRVARADTVSVVVVRRSGTCMPDAGCEWLTVTYRSPGRLSSPSRRIPRRWRARMY